MKLNFKADFEFMRNFPKLKKNAIQGLDVVILYFNDQDFRIYIYLSVWNSLKVVHKEMLAVFSI